VARALAALAAGVAGAALLLAFSLRAPPAGGPAPGAALSGLVLVEPGGARRSGVTLVARDGRIASLGPDGGAGASDRYAGRFLLPGLVDLHVHHPPAAALGQRGLFALLFLAHGVTSVRDLGVFDLSLESHRGRIERGERLGPRVFRCGRLLDGDPPGWPGARVVRSPADADAAVAAAARDGADCVKVYNGLDERSFAAVRAAAGARGLRVVGHVPWAVAFERLERVEVQHLMGLADDWPSATPERIRAYVAHSAAHGLSHLPTLVAFERAARLEDAEAALRDPAARLLPRVFRELLWSPGRNPLVFALNPGVPWGQLGARVELMQRAVRALHAAGVPVLAGTDAMNPFVVPGASLHEELRLLAAAGLGAEGALLAATRGAGEVLGVPGLGRLEPGAPADAALFREDPTRDLAALASLEAVIAGGRLVPREALLEAAAAQRAHFDRAPYAPLFEAAARAVIAVTAGD
jgi:imidazolonepropionase-like amidohydrolase